MFAVRYVALAALTLWLGGMLTLGLLVAPSTFQVLQAADPETGRALAGALFGEVVRRFHLLASACGGLIVLCLLVMKFVGPPPRAFVARLAIVVFMLALELYSAVPMTREMTGIQSQVAGAIDRLPPTDARRVRFDRLHQTSTALLTINVAFGLVLLFWYARE